MRQSRRALVLALATVAITAAWHGWPAVQTGEWGAGEIRRAPDGSVILVPDAVAQRHVGAPVQPRRLGHGRLGQGRPGRGRQAAAGRGGQPSALLTRRLAQIEHMRAVAAAKPDHVPGPTLPPLSVELTDIDRLPVTGNVPRANVTLMLPEAVSGQLFVNDQRGFLYAVRDGAIVPRPVLDLNEARPGAFQGVANRGLNSFAFHPDYARPGAPGSGKIYTLHAEAPTAAHNGGSLFALPTRYETFFYDVVAEWTLDADHPDRLDPASFRELMRIAQPRRGSHSSGHIAFNPTAQPGDADYGMLYVGVGGYASEDAEVDPLRLGQNGGSVLGKVLRIEPLGRDGVPYAVPRDNPFVGTPLFLPEIWAYGFRHPQRFVWDAGGTGMMLIIDIGQDSVEEVNIGIAGGNYGWSDREGTFRLNPDDAGDLTALAGAADYRGDFIDPVVQYDHNDGDAISGGFVYRGARIPQLHGKYLFGDLVFGRIFYVDVGTLALGRQAPFGELRLLQDGEQVDLLTIVPTGRRARADMRFGTDAAGEIYILTKQDGMIRRLDPPPTTETRR